MELRWDSDGIDLTTPKAQRITHAYAASLSNYEAHGMGLPRYAEATLLVSVEGRIDDPNFRIETTYEPFDSLHPWLNTKRVGALFFVGGQMRRLNVQQMMVLDAIDAVRAADDNIAARLRAWPAVLEALRMQGKHHVLLMSDLPHVRLNTVKDLPADAVTRKGKDLVPTAANDDWAMQAGHRYFVKQAL